MRSIGTRRLTVAELVQNYSTEQLAPILSGTNVKRSKAYRGASRNIQRYRRTGRLPTGERWERLQGFSKRRVVRGSVHVHFEGDVLVSRDERFRVFDTTISALRFVPVRDAYDDGDHESATDLFEDAMFRSYGIPHAIATDVEVLTLRELK
jgi:hypothetical protein